MAQPSEEPYHCRRAGKAALGAPAEERALRARVQDFARRAELVQVLLSSLVPASLDDLATDEKVGRRVRVGPEVVGEVEQAPAPGGPRWPGD